MTPLKKESALRPHKFETLPHTPDICVQCGVHEDDHLNVAQVSPASPRHCTIHDYCEIHPDGNHKRNPPWSFPEKTASPSVATEGQPTQSHTWRVFEFMGGRYVTESDALAELSHVRAERDSMRKRLLAEMGMKDATDTAFRGVEKRVEEVGVNINPFGDFVNTRAETAEARARVAEQALREAAHVLWECNNHTDWEVPKVELNVYLNYQVHEAIKRAEAALGETIQSILDYWSLASSDTQPTNPETTHPEPTESHKSGEGQCPAADQD